MIENRLQELVEIVRRDAGRVERGALINHAFLDEIVSDVDGGKTRALTATGLQHPDLAVLDGEFDILHFLVVVFEDAADALELLVGSRQVLTHLRDVFRATDACNDIFALGIDQIFAVEDVRAAGRVSGESDACAGVLAHVAEHHGADVTGRSPTAVDFILTTVEDGSFAVP